MGWFDVFKNGQKVAPVSNEWKSYRSSRNIALPVFQSSDLMSYCGQFVRSLNISVARFEKTDFLFISNFFLSRKILMQHEATRRTSIANIDYRKLINWHSHSIQCSHTAFDKTKPLQILHERDKSVIIWHFHFLERRIREFYVPSSLHNIRCYFHEVFLPLLHRIAALMRL